MKWKELMNTPYGSLVRMLPYGKNNAVSQRSLSSALRISERGVRKVVEYIRCNSDPNDPETKIIASGREGYYIASTFSEMLEFYNTFHSRAITNENACKCARSIIDNAMCCSDSYLVPDLSNTADEEQTL